MRSKRVVLLSHCSLNQNAVILGWERARGPYNFVSILIEEGIGILQLPCPETLALGLKRPPMGYDDYDTPEHRALCEDILSGTIAMVKAHHEVGDKILGVIGIHESPNCSITEKRGIFMEVLFKRLSEEGFDLDYLEVPTDYNNDDETSQVDFHEKLKSFLGES